MLLTVAIPTFNRATYLQSCLEALAPQVERHGREVELLVLDNASEDATPDVVRQFGTRLRALNAVRHPENIGSDRNIAACFDMAKGRYVWVLGDDDIALPGTIEWLVGALSAAEYGLIYLRPFGFNHDHRREHPGSRGKVLEHDDVASFLSAVGSHIALISAIVVNKGLIPNVEAARFCGSNLVHVEVYLSAALRSQNFLYSEPYRVAYLRNNTGGYDFSKVFVEHMRAILERYCAKGLARTAATGLDRAMLLRYFPYHAWKMRRDGEGALRAAQARFRKHYGSYGAYWLLVDPIFALPRPLASLWGMLAILVGRTLSGDLRRGIHFALHRFTDALRH